MVVTIPISLDARKRLVLTRTVVEKRPKERFKLNSSVNCIGCADGSEMKV